MLKFCVLFTLVLTACQDVLFDEYEASFASTALFMPVVTPAVGELTPFAEVTPQIALYFYEGAPRGEIWYTTDGSDPTPSAPSIRYDGRGGTGPFTIPLSGAPMTATLKAISHKKGYMDSPILTAVWKSIPRPTNWMPATIPVELNTTFYKVCYGGMGRFVVVGDSKIGYSVDGITWRQANSILSNNIYSVYYEGGKFIAANDTVSHSIDGITWTTGYDPGILIYDMYYGAGKFVAVGNSGRIAYSADGITWTAVSNSPFTNALHGVYYGAGKFVAVGAAGTIGYSADGITWMAVSNSPFTGIIRRDDMF
jgi:hypothetical protein